MGAFVMWRRGLTGCCTFRRPTVMVGDFLPMMTIAYCVSRQRSDRMPQPCAVELHAYCYKQSLPTSRCHGLVPWSFTFTARKRSTARNSQPTVLISSLSNQREAPRRKAVTSERRGQQSLSALRQDGSLAPADCLGCREAVVMDDAEVFLSISLYFSGWMTLKAEQNFQQPARHGR